MRKLPVARGQVHRLQHHSALLKDNVLGDPAERTLLVYTPPDYDPSRRYPLMVDLVGYTGSGASHTNWKPFGFSLPERLDRLIHRGAMGPVIVAMPDCFTAYGGNQYIDSSAIGPYMGYLCDEIVPFLEQNFPLLPGAAHRGVFGKSSGGYGALLHGMKRTDVWGAAVCHSGDAYFEYCYLRDLPVFLTQVSRYGSVQGFLEALWGKEKLKGDEVHALMFVGMAAHYDPDPAAPLGFHLPADLQTGEIDWSRWDRWLAHDPVRMVENYAGKLRSLRLLWIDCGRKDQYHLLWGARMLHQRLVRASVPHHYEEFDDDHSDIDYRMDQSLPALYAAIREA